MTFYTPTGLLGVAPVCTVCQQVEVPPDVGETLSVDSEAIPPDIAESIRMLGKRSSPQETRRVIVQICSVRPFSAGEIARLVGRSKRWVLSSYLNPMIRDGQLEYVIPGEPNHPEQKYTVGRNEQEV